MLLSLQRLLMQVVSRYISICRMAKRQYNSISSSSNNSKHNNTNKFSFLVAVSFTINYIIGTGFLTLPWAFNQTGCLLGVFCLFCFCVFSIISSYLLLESLARANYIYHKIHKKSPSYELVNDKSLVNHSSSNNNNNSSATILNNGSSDSENNYGNDYHNIESNSSSNNNNNSDSSMPNSQLMVGEKKFEITELCDMFLGSTMKNIYTCVIFVYMYGTLAAYSSVFANALSTHLSIGANSYNYYLLFFSMLVVPPSLIELNEQVYLQVALTVCRIFMICFMIWTILDSYITQTTVFSNFDYTTAEKNNLLTNDIHMNKLYLLLPLAAFANIFHHSIPGLSEPVNDKRSLGKVFAFSLTVCFIAYSAIAITISLYFGSDTNVASNLNWQYYIGSGNNNNNNNSSSIDGHNIISCVISFFIVLFPAIDVASAFPLNAITLGNSLMTTYYGGNSKTVRSNILSNKDYILAKKGFRCIAAIPPILAAYFISDLGQITNFTGVTGFALAFVFPALLSYYSEKLIHFYGFSSSTIYSHRMWTSTVFQILIFSLGLILTVFVIFCNLYFNESTTHE